MSEGNKLGSYIQKLMLIAMDVDKEQDEDVI